MDSADLVARYPTVYHMADCGAWPSIQRAGLLPTRDIVDLYERDAETRAKLLERVRATSTVLSHPVHGRVTIRDQAPLKFLRECLTEGTTPQQYLDALNSRVYFWATFERLRKLLGARRYRLDPQIVLHVDMARLVTAYGGLIELAPYNTGSLHVPNMPKRGTDIFQSISDYPYEAWRKRRGVDALVEVTVAAPIPDISAMVDLVEVWSDGRSVKELYRRRGS